MTAPSSLLTPQEVAQRLGINGAQTLQALVREGRLPAYRFQDGSLGFFPADVLAITRPVPVSEALAQLEQPQTQVPATPAMPAQVVSEFRRLMRQVLDQEVTERAQRPRWLNVKQVSLLFGLDRERLLTLVRTGLVKQAKLGQTQQSPSLFKVQDIERVLEDIADGKLDLGAQ